MGKKTTARRRQNNKKAVNGIMADYEKEQEMKNAANTEEVVDLMLFDDDPGTSEGIFKRCMGLEMCIILCVCGS